MPHVSVHYKVYITEGHHRQPRNASSELEPNPSSEVDVTNPGSISPLYLPQLSYELGGHTHLSQLMFWSVTDGAHGQTYPAGPLAQTVGANPLTITAWYLPMGEIGDGTGTAIIDDAFSAVRGDFIDDTFVTVTSDPSLTDGANVVGVVPTASPETLQASATVPSTAEPFLKWMSFGAGTPSGDTMSVPQGASGLAIAFYERPVGIPPAVIDTSGFRTGGIVIGFGPVDGNGYIIINGVFHPIGPWNPLLETLVQASTVVAGSSRFAGGLNVEGRQLATKAVLQSIREITPVIEKQLEQM